MGEIVSSLASEVRLGLLLLSFEPLDSRLEM